MRVFPFFFSLSLEKNIVVRHCSGIATAAAPAHTQDIATEGRPFVPVLTMSHCVQLEFPIALLAARARASLRCTVQFSVVLYPISLWDSAARIYVCII